MSQRSSSRRSRRGRGSRQRAIWCGVGLTPGHRISIFITVLLVIIVEVRAGQSAGSAVEILAAAGAAAAQIAAWLNGQPLAAAQRSPGSTR